MRTARPSSTAILIARSMLLAAREPALRPLVSPAALAPLASMLAAAGGGPWFDLALRHAWTRRLLLAGERAVLPGIIVHYLARKRWIEQRVLATLDDGCEQLVVLGAGFDTLAWRLHDTHPGVQFFELDHPATQRPKTAAFGLVDNLALVPVDFAYALASASLLAHPRFEARRRTCVVAEGFLMYFPRGRVAEILSDLIRLPAGEVIFTFMAPGPDGHAAFRGGSPMIDAWLRLRGEPFAWALAPEHLENFLRPLGLNLRALAGSAELCEKILAPAGLANAPLAEGEHLCLATAP